MPSAEIRSALRLPFAEAIEFFRRKIDLPTETWRDIERAAHDRAFVVAGATRADLLADLRAAVDSAIADGTTLADFRARFEEIVARRGWTGWTGEDSAAGRAWRTRVIYQTNIRTSYAAGRWRQLKDPALLAVRPYWRYVHNDLVTHPRQQHKAWGDARLTLPHDHPFWDTHYPPSGWGCRCRVVASRGPEDGDMDTPPKGWDVRDIDTGAPLGVDEGWNYAPGANAATSLREMVQNKLIEYPQAIGRALTADMQRWIDASTNVPEFVERALNDRSLVQDLWLGFASPMLSGVAKRDVSSFVVLLPADAVRHVQRSHGFDGGAQRALAPEDYASAALWLREGSVVLTDPGPLGHARVRATYEAGGERYVSIWEIRPGKRNRSFVLVSAWVKT